MKLFPKSQRLFYLALAAFIITVAALMTAQSVSRPLQYKTSQAASQSPSHQSMPDHMDDMYRK